MTFDQPVQRVLSCVDCGQVDCVCPADIEDFETEGVGSGNTAAGPGGTSGKTVTSVSSGTRDRRSPAIASTQAEDL